MRIVVCTVCFNEIRMMPFWLRHYDKFCERIIAYDDASDDGTRKLLESHPKVDLRSWEYRSHLDDSAFLDVAQRTNEELSKSDYDWIIWADSDEFVMGNFKQLSPTSADVLTCRGYNMVGESLPVDDGTSQIWELHKQGVESPVYGKPIIYRKGICPPWGHGKHALYNGFSGSVAPPDKDFALFHYRYMGFSDTQARNNRNWGRVHEKTFAWSNNPEYVGEHSPQWADYVKTHGGDVVSQFIYPP